MNAVRGATSLVAKLTITNVGSTALSITGLTITGGEAANFVFGSKGGLPASLAAGASTTVTVAYKPPAATTLGIHTSSLVITSNDASKPSITVGLRGLATAGTGGQNEPSLQRLFDLYQFNIATGDKNPANTDLYSPTETLGASNEINVQRMVRSNAGAPVTVQALGTFAGGSPAANFGFYPAGLPNAKTQLLSINSGEAQTVALNPLGTNSFNPTSPFGLYVNFPIFGNTAYSEDSLNTTEGTAANRRKVRFYPLKNADGSTVPDTFVFTSEDFVNGNGAFDVNDFFGIIRNVKVASTGSIAYENLDIHLGRRPHK